jgi:hypothetical protein
LIQAEVNEEKVVKGKMWSDTMTTSSGNYSTTVKPAEVKETVKGKPLVLRSETMTTSSGNYSTTVKPGEEKEITKGKPLVLRSETMTTSSGNYSTTVKPFATKFPVVRIHKLSHHGLSSRKVPVIETFGKTFEVIYSKQSHLFLFQTCNDYLLNGFSQTGVYRLLRPDAYNFTAQCTMDQSGAWMVMQKRSSDSLRFWDRTFSEYSQGFGDPSNDHWLGLKHVRSLIDAGHKLKLKMEIAGNRCDPDEEIDYYSGTWSFEVRIL